LATKRGPFGAKPGQTHAAGTQPKAGSARHGREDRRRMPGEQVNLIPYNPTGRYDGSSPKAIAAFKNVLGRARVQVTVRLTRGRDIAAACGQLAANQGFQSSLV
jgi:hypothetical protein